eukprot:TRINITY_DN14355_c0_g1_i5.p1 TRINITY_DN14355_c0_g1~~TRINITY_DN14355_c0_g1_i5.p1  ORF type:complete len:242 (-),score=34.28 TRINITY_DN14355_c0_g1_i5:42-767(-)
MTRCQAGKVQRMGKLRNTRLCAFFLAQKCKYADQCSFAHDTDDILEKPNLAKTKICYKWQRGRCALSAAECRFAHGDLDKTGIALVETEQPLFSKLVSVNSTTLARTFARETDLDLEEELPASNGDGDLDRSMQILALITGHQAQSPNDANAERLGIDTAHAISPLAPRFSHEVSFAQSAMFKRRAMMDTCLTIFFVRNASMSQDEVTLLAALLSMTPPCPILAEMLEKLLQDAMPDKYED